tara:strand:- start:327 stop:1751 length:1425 start_codon:yes stop_codon:yes gene_type:complete
MNSNSNNPIPYEYRAKIPNTSDLLENALIDIVRNKKNKRHLLFNFCRSILTCVNCVCDTGLNFYDIFYHNYLTINSDFQNLRDINIMLNCLRMFNPPVSYIPSATGGKSNKVYLQSVVEEYCIELLNFERLCNSDKDLKDDLIDIFDVKISLLVKLFNQVVFEKVSINNSLGNTFNFINDSSNSFEKLSDSLSSTVLEEIVLEFAQKEGVKICCSIHSPKSGDILLNYPISSSNNQYKILEVKSTSDNEYAKQKFIESERKLPPGVQLYFGVFGGIKNASNRGKIFVSLNIINIQKTIREKTKNMMSFYKKLNLAYHFAFAKAGINNISLKSHNCDRRNGVLIPNLQSILQINNTADYIIFDNLHPVVNFYKKVTETGYIYKLIKKPTNSFGFIMSDSSGSELFFNSTPYLDEQYDKHKMARKICRVSYTEIPSTGYSKKPKAVNIKVINPLIKGIRKKTKTKRKKNKITKKKK